MSKNIEELFKQSLDNHEVSYDPSAWDSLQSKLDSKKITNKKSKLSNLKNIVLITTTLGVAGYFMFSNQTQTKIQEQKINNPKTETKETNGGPIVMLGRACKDLKQLA